MKRAVDSGPDGAQERGGATVADTEQHHDDKES